MVNGVNGVAASKPAVQLESTKSQPLDLNTVERRHSYTNDAPARERLFGLQTAPTYRPTQQEFTNPLKYIEKIAPHAKQFGIVKIIPPEGWQSTFAVDTETFQFRTRKQELNSMEAKCRATLNYVDQIFKYHTQHGTPIRGLPMLDAKPMDLYQLREVVEKLGGYKLVNNSNKSPNVQNLWGEVGKHFGFADNATMCLSLASNFKIAYQRYILPYETFLQREKGKLSNNSTPVKDGKDIKDVKMEEAASASSRSASPSRPPTSVCPATPPRQTSIAGSAPPSARPPSASEAENTARTTRNKLKRAAQSDQVPSSPSKKVATAGQRAKPGENCETCGKGDDGVHMLLCDGCEAGYHIYCLDPPLLAVPKIDWYCSRCLVGTGEFGFEEGGVYSLHEFQTKANAWKQNYFKSQDAKTEESVSSVTEHDVEKEFWRLVQDVNETVEVEYGADIHSSTHGSAFPTLEKDPRDPYSADPWNLNILPLLEDSLLRYIKTDISGMTVPWLYVGMCFSTFCWHNEDHYTYSVNYQHFGEAKTWYGIPGADAQKFEDVMKQEVPELFEQQPDLLLQLVTIFSPERLVKKGVQVYACDQHANEFVVTFPQAYHAGFNHGFNLNEAVNFAIPDWVSEGLSKACVDRYRLFSRHPVFSHDELLLTAAAHDSTIRTALWLAPALSEMTARELDRRKQLRAMYPTITEELFEEDVQEEDYQCGMCKTFCYLSQIRCQCTDKVTCTDHLEDLCDCDPNTRTIRLRYSDDALLKLEQKVLEKSKLPGQWRDKFFALLKDEPRPQLKTLRALLSEGERISYPIYEVRMLRQFVMKANDWTEEANGLISKRSINTNRRKSEKGKKMQAADPKTLPRQPEVVVKMIEDGKRLAFDSQEMEQLQAKEVAIRAWRAEARSLMAMPQISIDKCVSIIESGQALNVDLPEVRQFVTYVNQLRWLERARPAWETPIPLQDVIAMWEEGQSCGVPTEALEMHRLKQRREEGEAWEERVAQVLAQEKTSLETLTALAKEASLLCVKPETVATINAIVAKTQDVQTQVASIIARTQDPDWLQRPTANEYKELMEKLDSLTVRPADSDRLPQLYGKVNEWIRRGKRLFGKANAPLDIFGLHLEYVLRRNNACLSLEDVPRDPVEPSSREASPTGNSSQEMPKSDIFCMCRQPESGLMLECDVCHEWYHGKCLKVAKKDVKGDNKYICPICDWRIQIPRPSHRPKLEDMQELERDARFLPFQVAELERLQEITATAQRFRDRLQPFLAAYLVLTSAELPTLKFYLRKLEGAEVLLHAETNFFRRKIHEFHPIAPMPPPVIAESKSTKKPRLSKKKREELEAAGIDPAQHIQATQDARQAMSSASPSRPTSPPLHPALPSRLSQSNGPVFVGTVFETQPTYTEDGNASFASPGAAYQHASAMASSYESGSASPAANAFAKGSSYLANDYAHTQHLRADMQMANSSNLFAQFDHQGMSADMMSGVIKTGANAFSYVDNSTHHNHEDDQAAELLAGFSRGEVDGKLGGQYEGMHDGDDAMSEFLNP
ncbi:PLU-1-like protein-domain-containing protein [Protomyces lactucae-debilis]|uniref:[histone H3]-trimethyl-L-lysine(4) demethylase n=1 Tax=Protomyces lactucae-debilis TaxID=2754530 RepID=A0A1Y2EVG4_PROLT|nr:PLU-1-like protein-domain-containing protein [Protomyces lactucae-debilis]ORY74825.1 PLU-1-like protein-domain-containing protein [Protomyces lactucae-debilis]